MRRFMIDAMFPILVVLCVTVTSVTAGPPVNEDGQDEPRYDRGWMDYFETESNSVVIDDRSFRWTNDTEFLDQKGAPVSRDRFSNEMTVEFSSDDGRLTVLKLYAGEDSSYRSNDKDDPDIEPEVSDPGEIGGEIRQEGGVWTN